MLNDVAAECTSHMRKDCIFYLHHDKVGPWDRIMVRVMQIKDIAFCAFLAAGRKGFQVGRAT